MAGAQVSSAGVPPSDSVVGRVSYPAPGAHAPCRRVRSERISGTICAPVLLIAEVAAALSRGVGDQALAHEVVRHLARSQAVELIPVSLALAQRAAAIAADHRIRGCDAVYVALAAELEDRLVTLDQQQLERGAAVAVTARPGE